MYCYKINRAAVEPSLRWYVHWQSGKHAHAAGYKNITTLKGNFGASKNVMGKNGSEIFDIKAPR
jgi:hypothetical protein